MTTESGRVTAVAWLGAVFYLVNGSWAMVSPAAFYAAVAPFDPLNAHFLRDAGAFSLGLAAALLLGLLVRRQALPVCLLAAGIGSAAHVGSHVIDHAAGGRPWTDIPSLGVLSALLVVAGWRTLVGEGEA